MNLSVHRVEHGKGCLDANFDMNEPIRRSLLQGFLIQEARDVGVASSTSFGATMN